MALDALYRGTPRKVELEALSGGGYRVTVDGVVHDVDAQILPGNVYSLIIDGVHYEVDVSEGGEGFDVVLGGVSHTVEIVDPRRKLARSRLGTGHGPAVLKTSMPGKVVKILVGEGDEVARDAGVIVVEAMKMQNELRAPRAGTISKLFVKEGDTIEANAKLLSIE